MRESKSATLPPIAPAKPPQLELAPSDGSNSWRLADKHVTARKGVEVFVGFLTALFEAYPDKRENMAAAVRTRGRNNIARRVDELYPKRPEIGRRAHRALPGDWFVGTNESSGTKTLIAVRAAKAVGLEEGRDFSFHVSAA